MSPVRVIGIGSPFGLDRIGWAVVHALDRGGLAGRFPAGAVVLSAWDRPGSLLVEAFGGAAGVILIDAMRAGQAAGTPRRMTPRELSAAPEGFVSSHDVGIAQAIALADALGQLPARTLIYGIEIGAEGREPEGEADLERLCGRAVRELEPGLRADLDAWLAPARIPG